MVNLKKKKRMIIEEMEAQAPWGIRHRVEAGTRLSLTYSLPGPYFDQDDPG